MTTLRIMLLAMAIVPVILLGVVLWSPSKRKPKQELSFFDKLVDLIGSDILDVYNGVTYSQTRNDRDANDQPLNLGTDKWFKIKIGQYVSGAGDWGDGFDRTTCAVAEVYVDTNGKVLHVCAGYPYYNSPTKEKDDILCNKVENEIEEIKAYLASQDYVKLSTRDQWLRGVLDTIHKVTYIGEADLWKHCIVIERALKKD